MDPETAAVFDFVGTILPYAAIIVAMGVGGWVVTTWMRIKNGYPLETSWGAPNSGPSRTGSKPSSGS
jgi:hypothetical protein